MVDVEDLLNLKFKPFMDTIRYLAVLIGLIAFLVFFALSPMHALIFCGLLVMLGSMYLDVEKEIKRMAFYVGVFLTALGALCIFVPSLQMALLSVAEGLRQIRI